MTLPGPTPDQLRHAATDLGFALTEDQVEEYARLIDGALERYRALDRIPDNRPEITYPRSPGYRPEPEEDPLHAWVVKTSVRGASEGILAGRRVALKDNICLAGAPMTIGTPVMEGYVPDVDATVVTRVLEAGGEIAGKVRCEHLSRAGGSHTSPGEPVQNPHRPGHTTGGSSSGCGAVVGSGEVTMAIGGDQAGSIRFPASFCGIYGLKPTWGLVPYTGIAPLEHTLDHAGPMTATVDENALLLEAIAGADDGLDPRQCAPEVSAYTEALEAGVDGLRVGVLREGFGLSISEEEVDDAVRRAARRLADAGAEVSEISVPEHRLGLSALLPIFLQGNAAVIKANCLITNWRGLYVTGLGEAFAAWRRKANEITEGVKIDLLLAEHVERTAGQRHYAKAQNLSRRLRRRYDEALADHDVLVMPTVPHRALPIPEPDAPIEERLAPSLEATANTAPFNCTGHPALSAPCAKRDGLPIGMQLVSGWYREPAIYRVAAALERSGDWASF
jgi:amidase